MEIKFNSFRDLTPEHLYDILKLRVDVFVVEQKCAYPELDNQDQAAMHISGYENDNLIAYARILFEKGGLHIGRIIVREGHRGNHHGIALMKTCIAYCETNHPNESIHLSAQYGLEGYYQTFGFKTKSQPYDWDGILHSFHFFLDVFLMNIQK